ncbi:hypothetical protein BJ912DRAFT_821228, partial [Pholiota molesta]
TDTLTYPTSGLASFTGITGLGNPRRIAKTKNVIFDAQLFVTTDHILLGSVRYFNASNIEFDDAVRLYFVYVTFARNEIGTEVYPSKSRKSVDYDFIGDIQWPLYTALPAPDTVPPEPTVSIDFARPPFLHIVGVAGDCKKEAGTFRIDVEQYISFYKDSTPKPFTSFLCRFPDSPKYKDGKFPMPPNRRYMTITGFLSDVKYVNDIEVDGVEYFVIDIETIVFTG